MMKNKILIIACILIGIIVSFVAGVSIGFQMTKFQLYDVRLTKDIDLEKDKWARSPGIHGVIKSGTRGFELGLPLAPSPEVKTIYFPIRIPWNVSKEYYKSISSPK